MAVIVPWPISEPGDMMVTVPSAATRIHASVEAGACASLLQAARAPEDTAKPTPPR